MSRIKVLIFINSFRAGGSERQALEVIKRLDRIRFEPFVACFQKEGPLLSELPADVGVIHTFPLQSFFSWPAFKEGRELNKFIRQAGIQIIQCSTLQQHRRSASANTAGDQAPPSQSLHKGEGTDQPITV